MLRRLFQLAAVVFMMGVATLHVMQNGTPDAFKGFDDFLQTYWREVAFAVIAVLAAVLFLVTHRLRPVVVVFAAIGFFLIATMNDPSPAAFMAALDGLTATVLTGIDGFREG